MPLESYNKKRNFKKTPEPEGKIEKKHKQAIFVVQYHKARTTHYDFRLEHGGVLLSWAIPKGVPLNTKQKHLAVMVENHPLNYASFEGVIPKGNYGAGIVEIYDNGYYKEIEDFKHGLNKGQIKFKLYGNHLKGLYTLIKTDNKNWIMLKLGKSQNIDTTTSPNENLPFKQIKPQLATLTNKIPTGKNWIYEIKYDGYRAIAFVENKKTRLISRNGLNYTEKFSKISVSLLKLTKNISFILDGEVVCFDENGRTDFGLLQNNIKSKKDNFTYVIFDIIALGNKDLTQKPLLERKQILQNLLKDCPKNLMFSDHINKKAKEFFNMAKKLNLEGIIAKDINSTYNQTRDNTWFKIKCYKEQEFVIGGYTTSEKNNILSAILVGYYKNNEFIYIGKVGTGFNDKLKYELIQDFKKIKQNTTPFKNYNSKNEEIHFLKPFFIAQIKYAEITKNNLLRHPVFIGLRTDKSAKQVTMEEKNDK